METIRDGPPAPVGVDPPRVPLYPIAAVDNALQALQLVKERGTLRVADVSVELGIARSSAHRLLVALAYRGYVLQDPETKMYGAGPALVELGLSVVRNMDVRRTARPIMERIVHDTGETTSLVLLDHTHVLFVDCVEGSHSLRVASRTGLSMDAHCTAGGKAILATFPVDHVRRLYPSDVIPTMTDRSIATFVDLAAELDDVRRLGYATNLLESENGIHAVAVALTSSSGEAIGGITTSGPASRLTRSRMASVAQTMKRAVAESTATFA